MQPGDVCVVVAQGLITVCSSYFVSPLATDGMHEARGSKVCKRNA